MSTQRLLDNPSPPMRCLLAAGSSLPFLLVFLALHLWAWTQPVIRAGLLPEAYALTLGVLAVGIVFEVAVILWAWPRRHAPQPRPRVQLAVTTTIGAVFTLLMLLTGPYSTPMSLVVLGVLAVGLLLFPRLTVLRGFVVCAVLVVGFELLRLAGRIDATPVLGADDGGAAPPRWWQDYLRFLFFVGGTVLTLILFTLARALERQRARLEAQSRTDGLTGLLNRRSFMERLLEETRKARRHGRVYSVVLFDADHFKKVNDTWGHQAGDAVLREIARRLRAGVRGPSDAVARLGGEEFAVLLPETPAADAVRIATRIADGLRAHRFGRGSGEFSVTLSAGVAEGAGGERDDEGERLLHDADVNLYRAKHAGRDRVLGPG